MKKKEQDIGGINYTSEKTVRHTHTHTIGSIEKKCTPKKKLGKKKYYKHYVLLLIQSNSL